MVAGNVLVIVPLLALTANQLEKIKQAMKEYGCVDVTHLDKTDEATIHSTVIPRMLSLQPATTTTNFLLCSPQFIADHDAFRTVLLQCHTRRTLRLVAIDEIHLYTMHGRSFRNCIRQLTDCFFSIVFRQGGWHPLFLAMTATMTLSLLSSFSELTTVDWSLPARQLWSSASEF
jgi:superfamily II DNA helicase RecQ